jgi:RHH-type proline utilization regulon transcriptional repressor/proline dehydrogenase/delta 1-pyrroline-5-carboxylate dehydrogenase
MINLRSAGFSTGPLHTAGLGDDGANILEVEVVGPILHVVRWRAECLGQVLNEIAATGYGLTLGIHSRIDETVRHTPARLRVGNSYVNRSMIGAVASVRPLGGEGLSGTDPKTKRPVGSSIVSRSSTRSRPTTPP